MSESHRVGEVAYHTHPSKTCSSVGGQGASSVAWVRFQRKYHVIKAVTTLVNSLRFLLPLPWTLPLSILAGMLVGARGAAFFGGRRGPGRCEGLPERADGRRMAQIERAAQELLELVLVCYTAS